MKYIKSYANNSEYEAAKTSADFLTPNVGYIEDTKEVKYLNSKKDLYNIYGTLIGDSATATIQINGTRYSVSPSGSDNEFGLNYDQPVTQLSFISQTGIKTLDKIDVDTSAVTNMNGMFNTCYALTSLDVSNWNTSAVTNMSSMFSSCRALSNLDVSKWNTSAVGDMGSMFYGCEALTALDLSNFNTSAVTNMGYMFNSSDRLTTLDLSNWNTSAVTNTDSMFRNCNALTTLTMNNTNQTTFDMIKAQLVSSNVASRVTIIRDGHSYTYNGSEWVEA